MSCYGVAGKAAKYRAMVRLLDFIHISLLNDADEPILGAKCKVTFQDGQTVLVEVDDKGVLKFHRKTKGEITVEMLEEKEDKA